MLAAVVDIAICGHDKPVKADKIRDRLHLPSRRALETTFKFWFMPAFW